VQRRGSDLHISAPWRQSVKTSAQCGPGVNAVGANPRTGRIQFESAPSGRRVLRSGAGCRPNRALGRRGAAFRGFAPPGYNTSPPPGRKTQHTSRPSGRKTQHCAPPRRMTNSTPPVGVDHRTGRKPLPLDFGDQPIAIPGTVMGSHAGRKLRFGTEVQRADTPQQLI
jgi:hypothetical protein